MSEWGELEGIKITGDPDIPQNKVKIQMTKKQTKASLKTRLIYKWRKNKQKHPSKQGQFTNGEKKQKYPSKQGEYTNEKKNKQKYP